MHSDPSQTAESQYTVLSPGTPPPEEAGAVRELAVFVTHGMGQQVPFATLDAVFEQLRRLPPFSSARPEAETVRLGGQQMQRLVLRLPSLAREVHFFLVVALAGRAGVRETWGEWWT